MKVLIILPNLDLGGTEVVVMNYLRQFSIEFTARGKSSLFKTDACGVSESASCDEPILFDFAVHGETGYFEEEARLLGAKIFRVPTRGESFFGNIRAMRRLYHENKYDFIIVCTEHSFAFIEVAVAWFSGIKTRAVWSHFSGYQGKSRLKRHLHLIGRPFLRMFTNMFFACTLDAGRWLFGNTFARNLQNKAAVPPLFSDRGELRSNDREFKKNFHIINNAIDLDKFAFNQEVRDKIRYKIGLGDAFAVGIVGRLAAVKNHIFALESFAKIDLSKATFAKADLTKTGFSKTEAVLIIIGDGEMRAQIEEMAERLGISSRVFFTNAVENVHEYYQALDLLLMPSLHEGFGMVAIEAQASGLQALISDTVPQEVKVSELAFFKSLDDGADAWATEISRFASEKWTRPLNPRFISIGV